MEYKIKPWAHQLTAIERAAPEHQKYFALFFEMGSGKSMTAVNIIRHKMVQMGRYLRTIIFCPPIVVPNWRNEILMNSKIPEDRIVMLSGSSPQRLQTFMKNAYLDGKPRPCFFITNYESLILGSSRTRDAKKTFIPGPLFLEMQKWEADALVFDESHKLKNYKAERSKHAERLANPRQGRRPLTYLLSGSPVLNSPMDLFFQFKVMDGGDTFGNNFFIFRAKYFYDKNAGMPKDSHFPDWQVLPGAVEEMNKLLFKNGMRVTKSECLDLPEEVSVTIKCKMLPAQAKAYKEMKRDLITYVEDKTASVTISIVKALRLMQITSGFLPLDPTGQEQDAAKVVYKDNEKEAALRELLETLTPHSKVIVWAVWKENYAVIREICEELKIGYVEVHGGVSRSKQNDAVERFKSDDSARVFLGHPGSGGIGINLVVAPYSIFYSRTFSLEHWLQARARNHRGGQTQKVTHYDLVTQDTIDEIVQSKLAHKFSMSEDLLDMKKLVNGIQNQHEGQ